MPQIKPVRGSRRERKRLRAENPKVRRRLLQAANDLIEEQGFPQLRIEEVAQRAQLSVGTLYLYFEGKSDLFTQLSMEHTQELQKALRAAYRGEGTVGERLYSGLVAYLDFVEGHEKCFLYFRDAGSVHTTVGSLTAWTFGALADEIRPVLEEGIECGELAQMESEILAQAILGQIHHVVGYWLDHRESYARCSVQTFLAELISTGIVRQQGEA